MTGLLRQIDLTLRKLWFVRLGRAEFRQLSLRELEHLLAEYSFSRTDVRVASAFAERYDSINVTAEFNSAVFNDPQVFPPNEADKLFATGTVDFLPNGNCHWSCSLTKAVELAAYQEARRSTWTKNSRYVFSHRCVIHVPRDLLISFA